MDNIITEFEDIFTAIRSHIRHLTDMLCNILPHTISYASQESIFTMIETIERFIPPLFDVKDNVHFLRKERKKLLIKLTKSKRRIITVQQDGYRSTHNVDLNDYYHSLQAINNFIKEALSKLEKLKITRKSTQKGSLLNVAKLLCALEIPCIHNLYFWPMERVTHEQFGTAYLASGRLIRLIHKEQQHLQQ